MSLRKQIIATIIILTIIFGISIRWINLGQKVYWYDEVVPTLRVVGYGWRETQEIMTRNVFMTAEELQDFQTFSKGKNWDQIFILNEQIEHPPLYFAFQRLIALIFGPSPTVFRIASVVFSLLTFPALAWLCWELFEDLSVSGIAPALFAVSPIQVAYAQEAKPYSYLVLSVLLSSAMLISATKHKKSILWGTYGISLAFTLYSSLLAVLYLFAHGIWMTFRRQRSREDLYRFWLAVALGIGLYSPWLYRVLSRWDTIQYATQWTRQPIELRKLVISWVSGWAHSILDLGYNPQVQSVGLFINSIVCFFLLTIVLTATIFSKTVNKRAIRFCLLLSLFPFGIMILRDLISHGRATTAARYYLPSISILLIDLSHMCSSGEDEVDGSFSGGQQIPGIQGTLQPFIPEDQLTAADREALALVDDILSKYEESEDQRLLSEGIDPEEIPTIDLGQVVVIELNPND
ncbi:MAG: glycosyltransferase family 39 protein [Leptolyngbyaceae cyanobacterium]